MTTLDELLIEAGVELDRLSAEHGDRADGAGSGPGPRRWIGAVAAAVALVGVAGVIVVDRRSGDPGSVVTTEPGIPLPTVSTGPAPTAPTSTNATPSPSTTIDASQPTGYPLTDVGPGGAPAAPAVLPDGYRVVIAGHGDSANATVATVSPPPDGAWSATYIRRLADPSDADFLHVSISPNGSPGDLDQTYPDLEDASTTVGAFTGRFGQISEPNFERIEFVAPLDDGRLLSITGHAARADVEVLIGGLQLRSDGPGVDATVLPDGYATVSEGPGTRLTSTAEWSLAYARGSSTDSLISVRASVDPMQPAVQRLTSPGGATAVDVNGVEAFLAWGELIFDPVPGYQIVVGKSPMDSSVSDEQLIEFARLLTAISDDEFAELTSQAQSQPLTPTDMPCSFYMQTSEPRSEQPLTYTDGPWSLAAPGAVTFDLATNQSLIDVQIGVRAKDFNGPGFIPLMTLPSLNETHNMRVVPGVDSPTITIEWDGMIDGAPAPPGNYDLTVIASPASTEPDMCKPGSLDELGTGSLFISFVVS